MDLFVTIIFIALYFLPTVAAILNKHHNANAIAVLNLTLGWTVIGWIVAMIWATTAPPPKPC